jgi:uncharacterized membrane protein YecN with MAPEG domain
MHVTIYISIYAMIIVWLSINVINHRYKHKVSVGDNGVNELRIAMATQSNAIEYLPVAALLLLVLELNGAWPWLIHIFGIFMVVGRFFHIKGMFAGRLNYRVWGMKITLYSLIALAVVNIGYLIYAQVYS